MNLNTGIFVELRSCIAGWFEDEGGNVSPEEVLIYTAKAMDHWHKFPLSKAYPTLRALSSLHGIMRFDPDRRFKAGDSNDFMIAASALPIAEAFFTDRRLASILREPKIGLGSLFNCAVVSGFEEMAAYLNESAAQVSEGLT